MKNLSLLRKLQYEELSKLKLDGRVLDLGGSRRSGYHELISGEHKIDVVNISDDSDIDFKFNIEEKFPIENEAYDVVLCINVLEHIYNFNNVLSEGFRVLKKDGIFIGTTPFLFNVHASPNDYFRYTKSALEKMFDGAGFDKVEIKELGTGLFSVIYQLKFGIFHFKFLRGILIKIYPVFDKILKILKPKNFISSKDMPLGYFFIARKK